MQAPADNAIGTQGITNMKLLQLLARDNFQLTCTATTSASDISNYFLTYIQFHVAQRDQKMASDLRLEPGDWTWFKTRFNVKD